MFRSTLLSLLVASTALAQNTSIVTDLLQTLNSTGLTGLAKLFETVANTTVGQALIADLPNGNKTLFAPINVACAYSL